MKKRKYESKLAKRIRIRKQKKAVKKISFRVASLMIILILLNSFMPLQTSQAIEENNIKIKDIVCGEPTISDDGNLKLETRAEAINDTELQVSLNINKIAEKALGNEEFILIMDNSTSMAQYLNCENSPYKDWIDVLNNKLAEQSNNQAKITELFYNVESIPEGSTNQFSTLEDLVNQLPNLLQENNNKSIVLITDGVVTDSVTVEEVLNSEQENSLSEESQDNVQIQVEGEVSGNDGELQVVEEVTEGEGVPQEENVQQDVEVTVSDKAKQDILSYITSSQTSYVNAKNTIENNQEKYGVVKTYTIKLPGIFEDVPMYSASEQQGNIVEVLKSMQNSGEFVLEDMSKINEVFDNIINNAKAPVKLRDSVVEYALSENFEVVDNSVNVVGSENTDSLAINISEDKSVINIKLGSLDSDNVTINFNVKVKNEVNAGADIDIFKNCLLTYKEDNVEIESSLPMAKVVLEEVNYGSDLENSEEENVEINTPQIEDVKNSIEVLSNTNVQVNKTANITEDDRIFEIELTVKGGTSIDYGADIILVMDSSGSMGGNGGTDYHTPMRNSMKECVTKFLPENSNNRVSIIDFSGATSTGSVNGSSGDATLVSDFSNNHDRINGLIDGRTSKRGGSTNMDAAYRIIKQQLDRSIGDASRKNAKRYVIFFTDGLPTSSVSGTGNGSVSNPTWGYTVGMNEYDKIQYDFFSGNQKKTWYKSPFNAVVSTYNTIKGSNASDELKKTKVYNILLENYGTGTGAATIVNNLFGSKTNTNITNVYKRVAGEMNDGNNYSTVDVSKLSSIYNDISNSIIAEIHGINKATITDIVTDEFIILPNQYNADGTLNNTQGSITSVIRTLGTPSQIMNITPTISDNTISWYIENIPPEGVSIKFRVKAKDDYYGTPNDVKIYTNKDATLVAEGGISKEFPKPAVGLDYTKGSIKIIKSVINSNGEVIENNKISQKDRFAISMTRSTIINSELQPQRYTVDLIGNDEATLDFYLKDISTDISNNTDKTLNYFTIGEYLIDEVVPMNYEQVEILVNTSNGWKDINSKEFNGKVEIDKDNPNVEIKVVNKLVNESYWFDKEDKENTLTYSPS